MPSVSKLQPCLSIIKQTNTQNFCMFNVHNRVLLYGGSFSSIIKYKYISKAHNAEAFYEDGAFGLHFEYLLSIQIELRLQPTYYDRWPQRFTNNSDILKLSMRYAFM